ncbi:MAG TPA: hypothetical protein VMS22_15550 [Candidatus Eisenbacteria bacterium]|nr:hypothetical protein [Candidatus Eisenbacteria bacterium]
MRVVSSPSSAAARSPSRRAGALLSLAVPLGTVLHRGLFAPEYFQTGHTILAYIAGLRPGYTWTEAATTILATWAGGAIVYAPLLAIAAVAGIAAARLRVGARLAGIVVAVIAATWAWWRAVHALPRPMFDVPQTLLMVRAVALTLRRYDVLPLVLLAVVVCDAVAIRRARPAPPARVRRLLVAATGFVLLARVPAALVPCQYANFYLPVGIVLLGHASMDELPRLLARLGANRDACRAAVATVVAIWTIAVGALRYQAWAARDVPVETSRGTLVVLSANPRATAYREALAWLEREAPPDATLLAIPRGTSLEFLSGHGNRLYETSLVAVIPDAAAERAYVQALERDPPSVIVTSEERQSEYGRGRWGIADGVEIARWVRSRYVPAAQVGPPRIRLAIWRLPPARPAAQ